MALPKILRRRGEWGGQWKLQWFLADLCFPPQISAWDEKWGWESAV